MLCVENTDFDLQSIFCVKNVDFDLQSRFCVKNIFFPKTRILQFFHNFHVNIIKVNIFQNISKHDVWSSFT